MEPEQDDQPVAESGRRGTRFERDPINPNLDLSTKSRSDFPTMAQVNQATHELARWYRFLASGESAEQQRIMDRIVERFNEAGE
jgi:hypothetical protein